MGPIEVRRVPLVLAAVAALTLFLVPVDAQYVQAPRATETYGPDRAPLDQQRDWSNDIPAHLSFVTGTVTLERDGKWEPAEANIALLAGDRLRTRGGGRVEILFADGSAITLDEESDLDLLSDQLVRLLEGRMRLTITRATAATEYRVDAPVASVWIRAPGDYRVESINTRGSKPEVLLTVFRGSAELVNQHGRTLVRAGSEAVATSDLAPSLPYAVNSADADTFDAWTNDQREERVSTVSGSYIPTELRYYGGAFDRYGRWDHVAPYGRVWYPRVSHGWRPYSQGRWSFSAHFGWFWVGIDRWSWPTHHYGGWGYSDAGWYWMPNRYWAPAWVSWAYAPGYVSWCPLGWNGVPAIPIRSVGFYDPWTAWTILPRRHFVPNVWVTQHVVGHNTIAPAVRTQFAARLDPIHAPATAVRRIDPLRAPTFTRVGTNARAGRPAYDGAEAWREQPISTAVPRDQRVPSAPRVSPDSVSDAPSRVIAPRAEPRSPSASPDRSDTPERSRILSAKPRTEVPRVESPRARQPEVYSPDSGVQRAAPRNAPAQSQEPPPSYGASRTARPTAPASREPDPEVSRARPRSGVEPSRSAPPPSAQSQPEPDRSRSRAVDRSASPPPPSSSAPPPSSGGPSRIQRPDPPSTQSPPASRGGGSGDTAPTRAVPRGRGGNSVN